MLEEDAGLLELLHAAHFQRAQQLLNDHLDGLPEHAPATPPEAAHADIDGKLMTIVEERIALYQQVLASIGEKTHTIEQAAHRMRTELLQHIDRKRNSTGA